MKIRHGFVSNSSSSSFVVISKEPLSVIKPANMNTSDWEYVRVTTKEASYGRADITLCRTIEDKLRHFTVLYAMHYAEDKDYFFKMDSFREKIRSLGKKYGYMIAIECPPLSGFVHQSDQGPEVVNYIDINNECEYASDVANIVENEDTTELESYLFNPHSFCVLGGNEYPKTRRLAHKMRKFVDKEGYEYRKFGDIIEDHEVGDLIPGTKALRYTDAYHWGEYTFKDRIREQHVNLYLLWRKIKDHKRIAMLKKVGAYED